MPDTPHKLADRATVPLTDEDRRGIRALVGVTFVVGGSDKRYAQTLHAADRHHPGAILVTPGQLQYLWRMVYRYRRQIQDKDIVAVGKRRREEL